MTSRHLRPVNSESENEEDPVIPTAETDEDNCSESLSDEAPPNYEGPDAEKLKPGSYVLVKVQSGRRKATKYTYAAIVQNINSSHKTYKVMGLKSIDTAQRTFKAIENNVFTVNFEDIQVNLSESNIMGTGKRMQYCFNVGLDVLEA